MNIRGTEWEASMSIAELTIELSKMIKAENASKKPYDDKSAFLGPNKERDWSIKMVVKDFIF